LGDDSGGALIYNAQWAGCYFGEVDDALVPERAPVRNAYNYSLASLDIGNAQAGAKGQRLMCAGIFKAVETLTTASAQALVLAAIPRSSAA
jgi:hypothetical protein